MQKSELYLIYPRWFFPNNLGDSVLTTFLPKVLYEEYNKKVTVITYGPLVDLFNNNPYVHKAVNGIVPGTYDEFKNYAINKEKVQIQPNIKIVFPEWHEQTWKYWNSNFDFLSKHKTANILTVNYLLQLGLEKYLYKDIDLSPVINVEQKPKEQMTLGIVPATKLSGRPTPHPGCNGKGLRFNGDNGESWKIFVEEVKRLNNKIKILEYSYENFGFGDEHIPHKNDWLELAKEASRPKVVILSDGGMHHVFNSQKTSVVYLSAQSINKPWHYMVENTTVYWDLFDKCLSKCTPEIKNLNNWEGLNNFCDLSCEKVDSARLAQYVVRDFFFE